jgi:Arc/MetJ family transcription regulator
MRAGSITGSSERRGIVLRKIPFAGILLFLLTVMHGRYILMHMRTTLNIEAKLIEEAARLTGVTEKTALVRMGLAALIAREGARRLADLGGTEKNLRRPPRRRSVPAA